MKKVWLPIFEEQYHALTGEELVDSPTIRYVNDWRNASRTRLDEDEDEDEDGDAAAFAAM